MINKVLSIVKEARAEAVLVSNPYNMRYISGFSGGTGYLYISDSQRKIVTDSRYTNQAIKEGDKAGFEVVEIGMGGYIKAINELIKMDKVKALGFEGGNLLYSDYSRFNEMLNCDRLVNIGNGLDKLRLIKNCEEIEYLKKAELIGDKAFTKILDIIKPGITEIEVGANLEYFMKMEGAQGLSFETIVASGINSSMPHAGVSDKKIEMGDFVTMDFGCIYNGYCSDMTRTIVVGKANERQKKIYNTVLKAQLAAMEHIREGAVTSEVDKVARDIINNAGFEGCFLHGLGHSVGMYIHEEPRLSPSCNVVLQSGMTQTVEPGIYIKDYGGVRIEDMVIVTKEGYINTTSSQKSLIEL